MKRREIANEDNTTTINNIHKKSEKSWTFTCDNKIVVWQYEHARSSSERQNGNESACMTKTERSRCSHAFACGMNGMCKPETEAWQERNSKLEERRRGKRREQEAHLLACVVLFCHCFCQKLRGFHFCPNPSKQVGRNLHHQSLIYVDKHEEKILALHCCFTFNERNFLFTYRFCQMKR